MEQEGGESPKADTCAGKEYAGVVLEEMQGYRGCKGGGRGRLRTAATAVRYPIGDRTDWEGVRVKEVGLTGPRSEA